MVRKTKEDAQATRALILDTAEHVFQRRGVAATTLQQIAHAAGLTRGAIYWHFQNKADVFDAMLQRVALPLECSFDVGCASAAADPLGFLRRGFGDVLAKLVRDEQVQRVLEIAMHKVEFAGDLAVVRERRITSRNRMLADVERVFVLANQLGQIGPNPAPRMATLGLHALIDGLLYNWLLDPQA
ncbi:MAG: TetR family transcriptional regulator, partial [Burkholderiaceae bacterium]